MNGYKFGYKPSNGNFGGVDVEDFQETPALVAAASKHISNTHVIDTSKVPTKDQGRLSACAGFSTTTALEICQALHGKFEALSPTFTYYNARARRNNIGMDDGSYIHDNFYSLETLGTCSLSLWKTDPARVSDTPSIIAYKQANDNKISTFRQITRTGSGRLDDVETAIRANLPVVWGTAVGERFMNHGDSNAALNPPKDSEIKGLHATVLVGVRNNAGKREFCLLNSWGNSWGTVINGKGGFCWVTEDYLLNKNSADFFVAEAMTQLLV